MAHRPLNEMLHLVLTDVEMPEMDGYILTKMIKTDIRFAGIPVLMHSLAVRAFQTRSSCQSVGVDEYVSKFEPPNWPRDCQLLKLDAPQSTLLPSGQGHPAARLTPFTRLKMGLKMTASGFAFANIDARTKLAGSNKMEILLFTLGTREIFGINVFKVREVSQTPEITKTPNML